MDSEIWAVSAEYLPLEHSEHGAEPFTSLYVPAMHAAHAVPSGPVYPLLQVQLVSCCCRYRSTCARGSRCTWTRRSQQWLYCTCPESTVSTALSRSRPCTSPRCTLRIASHQDPCSRDYMNSVSRKQFPLENHCLQDTGDSLKY